MSDLRKPAPEATDRTRDLREVNQRLKELVASLRTEKDRLADHADHPAVTPAPAAPLPETVDLEKKRLAAELALAREAVVHAQEERERLRERLAGLQAEHQRICDDYVAVQEKSTDLAQLYVALERLHGGATRADTLAAIQEIVVNLVGSEELAVFERRDGALALVHAFGVPPRVLDALRPGEGALSVATAGKLYVAGREGPPAAGEEDLTAAIPLRAGDEIAGVIAIFRLLGHKPALADSDDAVFDLLSAHAGLALRLRDPHPAAAR